MNIYASVGKTLTLSFEEGLNSPRFFPVNTSVMLYPLGSVSPKESTVDDTGVPLPKLLVLNNVTAKLPLGTIGFTHTCRLLN